MFVATVVNLLLASLNTGSQIALFVVFIREALVLNPDLPLVERPQLVNRSIWKLDVVADWAGNLPVSSNPSLPDFALKILGEDIAK